MIFGVTVTPDSLLCIFQHLSGGVDIGVKARLQKVRPCQIFCSRQFSQPDTAFSQESSCKEYDTSYKEIFKRTKIGRKELVNCINLKPSVPAGITQNYFLALGKAILGWTTACLAKRW